MLSQFPTRCSVLVCSADGGACVIGGWRENGLDLLPENLEPKPHVEGEGKPAFLSRWGETEADLGHECAAKEEVKVKPNKSLRRSEIYEGIGSLPDVADQATAAGFRYFSLNGNIFELETGRIEGSSLGLHSLKRVNLSE